MPFMWADTLLASERAHLLRLLLWGAASVLVGTALIATMGARRHRSPLLYLFALVTAGWGVADVILALWELHTIASRDLAGATRLDRFLWFNVGLDAGYLLVGLTLAVMGWRLARRAEAIGAGIAIVVQGLALAVLELVFANQISR